MRLLPILILAFCLTGCPAQEPTHVRGEGWLPVDEHWPERERRLVRGDVYIRHEKRVNSALIEDRWFVQRAGSLRTEIVPADVEVPRD